jgi:hypothetical protein
MGTSGQTLSPSRTRTLYVVGGGVTLAALMAGHILNERRRLRRASHPGRAVSASVSTSGPMLTTFNRAGQPGDPINMQVVGSDGQLGASFAAAGWYRADEIDLVTSARISADSILGRKYSTAPVSNLYLYGRKEDYAFERPGGSVRQRDHIRFWNTGRAADDGRPIWIGSATRDIKVELSHTDHLPTHGISPDLDAERKLVVSELAQTGYVVNQSMRPGFGKETHGVNGGGDPFFTDGQVVELTLANVWKSPLSTQVRSPLVASIAQALERWMRGRLPQQGLDRAAQEIERLRRRPERHLAPTHERATESPTV